MATIQKAATQKATTQKAGQKSQGSSFYAHLSPALLTCSCPAASRAGTGAADSQHHRGAQPQTSQAQSGAESKGQTANSKGKRRSNKGAGSRAEATENESEGNDRAAVADESLVDAKKVCKDSLTTYLRSLPFWVDSLASRLPIIPFRCT